MLDVENTIKKKLILTILERDRVSQLVVQNMVGIRLKVVRACEKDNYRE